MRPLNAAGEVAAVRVRAPPVARSERTTEPRNRVRVSYEHQGILLCCRSLRTDQEIGVLFD